MMRLYQFAVSPFCAKLRKILDFKGVDYEAVEVDYVERKELVMASGQMMVPALTLDHGETLVDSDRIAMVLEKHYPDPTLFPRAWQGVHLALARYFDTELEEALFRAAVPYELAHYQRQGGFVEQMVREHSGNLSRAHQLLAPLEDSLSDRAFILGRIGYADFALYGQLTYFAISGTLAIPASLPGVRAFFERINRISSAVEG
jgi:glutathione S-transferase